MIKRVTIAAACGLLLAAWPSIAAAQGMNPRGKPVVKKPPAAPAAPGSSSAGGPAATPPPDPKERWWKRLFSRS